MANILNLVYIFREYPSMAAVADEARTNGRDADKQDYVALLRELHDKLKPHGYILSAAVSAGKPTIDRAYDVPSMMNYLDIVNVMTYDFHGGWEQKTGIFKYSSNFKN